MARKESAIAKRRLVVSTAIVVMLVACVPLVDTLVYSAGRDGHGDADFSGIRAHVLLKEGGLEDALSRLEVIADDSDDPSAAPAWFQEEVGFLPGARDVRIDELGSVVGYVVGGDSKEVLDDLCAALDSKGWIHVPLGDVEGATFLKESGVCTWMLVTCTQVGSSTSVVARCNVA